MQYSTFDYDGYAQYNGGTIIVNGVKGYVGGSNATDLTKGVKACAEAIEDATTKATKNVYDDDDDEWYDPYDDEWYGTIVL